MRLPALLSLRFSKFRDVLEQRPVLIAYVILALCDRLAARSEKPCSTHAKETTNGHRSSSHRR